MHIYKSLQSIKKGFTLIEILIAITIIGVLIGITTVSFSTVQRNSRDARRKGDLKAVQTALEQFHAQNGSYPNTNMLWRGLCSHAPYNPTGDLTDSGATGYIPGLAPNFIPVLPRDPREDEPNIRLSSSCTGATSCYLYRSNGVEYKMMTYCTPEGPAANRAHDPMRDPRRPTFGYAIYTPGAAQW